MEQNQSYEPQVYERLDRINDQLHAICRLVSNPHAVQAAPEVMDAIVMALDRVHALYLQLAFELRKTVERSERRDEVTRT